MSAYGLGQNARVKAPFGRHFGEADPKSQNTDADSTRLSLNLHGRPGRLDSKSETVGP